MFYYYGVCGEFLLFFFFGFSFLIQRPLSFSPKLLATSLRLDNRAPLGAGSSCAPGLFLAKSGSCGLNRSTLKIMTRTVVFVLVVCSL